MKVAPDAPILDKVFTIDSTHVYPETQGALFIGDDISLEKVGVIDLGHKNNNCTIWEQAELLHKYSVTGNLGGGKLSANIARVLTKEFTFCDEDTVMHLLAGSKDQRYLHTNSNNEAIKKEVKRLLRMNF